MSVHLDDGDLVLHQGDASDVLAGLPDGSVDCCVTSPPYYGLRDYGTGEAQIGLEETPDAYIERLVAVFREVRRVLADHGTLWLNLGDSYATGQSSDSRTPEQRAASSTLGPKRDGLGGHNAGHRSVSFDPRPRGMGGAKPKDLLGIPWMVAFALRADGWYLRSDIVWAKPNPMPESVRDRPTKAHEYVFLLSKQPTYYFDQEAVREAITTDRAPSRKAKSTGVGHAALRPNGSPYDGRGETRNIRSVWAIPTQPFPEAHFATFPEELPRLCIEAGCPPMAEDDQLVRTGTVLDPFLGSGTTALVARKLGRRCIGIDLSAEYLEIAARRTQQLSLLGGAA